MTSWCAHRHRHLATFKNSMHATICEAFLCKHQSWCQGTIPPLSMLLTPRSKQGAQDDDLNVAELWMIAWERACLGEQCGHPVRGASAHFPRGQMGRHHCCVPVIRLPLNKGCTACHARSQVRFQTSIFPQLLTTQPPSSSNMIGGWCGLLWIGKQIQAEK